MKNSMNKPYYNLLIGELGMIVKTEKQMALLIYLGSVHKNLTD